MNILPYILAGIAIVFAFVHDRYLKRTEEQHFQQWLYKHYSWLITVLLISLFVLLIDKEYIHTRLFAHPGTLFSLLFVVYV